MVKLSCSEVPNPDPTWLLNITWFYKWSLVEVSNKAFGFDSPTFGSLLMQPLSMSLTKHTGTYI